MGSCLWSGQHHFRLGMRARVSIDDDRLTVEWKTSTRRTSSTTEWRVDIWVAAVDFKKAFASIHHDAILRSLRNRSVSEQCVSLLAKLYDGQSATVLTKVQSKKFQIAGGTKQADPLSSLSFNSVFLFAMEKDMDSWKEKFEFC